MSQKIQTVVTEKLPLVITVSEGVAEESIVPNGVDYLIVDYDNLFHEEKVKIVNHEMKDFEIEIRFQESIFALITVCEKEERSNVYEFVCENQGDRLIPIRPNYKEVPITVLERVDRLINQESWKMPYIKLIGHDGSFDIEYKELISILNRKEKGESLEEFLWSHTTDDVELIYSIHTEKERSINE